jgi:hypothetical protein
MATTPKKAAKTASKAPAAKKVARGPSGAPQAAEQRFAMPVEVRDWIEQASSRIKHLTSEVERLKAENVTLRRANKVMEGRVMGMSRE